jgi:putative peptidoglycan lipid II flippase
MLTGATGARLVAAGILLSRVFGLVRQKVSAHFLGTELAADALAAAFRIPNFLQNLFGEGVLSASFIPVYSRLVAEGKREEAGRVAGSVLAILALATAVVVLLGVLAAPWLVWLIAGGFDAATQALTVRLVRIIFPGVGVLVLSAWCLGVLNSHRRFFLSYASPVLWNLAIIAALLLAGPSQAGRELVVTVAWASVAGSVLQFAIQVPAVRRLDRDLRLSMRPALGLAAVRTVLGNFGAVFTGRGVVQISGFVDAFIASMVGPGALATLAYSQAISMLPVSLFGMSVSAAELPAMSGARGSAVEVAAAVRARLDRGLGRIAYFVVPSAAAFLLIGGVLAAGLFEGGQFTRADAQWVWGALAGAAVGLLASTMGRLYASASYALGDARTPLRFAIVRVALGAVLGWSAALWLPGALSIDARWGVAFLTAASGVAAWVEYVLLRRALSARVGTGGVPSRRLAALWACALAAGLAGVAATRAMTGRPALLTALVVVPLFGAVYLGATRLAKVDDARRT